MNLTMLFVPVIGFFNCSWEFLEKIVITFDNNANIDSDNSIDAKVTVRVQHYYASISPSSISISATVYFGQYMHCDEFRLLTPILDNSIVSCRRHLLNWISCATLAYFSAKKTTRNQQLQRKTPASRIDYTEYSHGIQC